MAPRSSTNNDLSVELGEIKGMAQAILRELDQAREDRKERDTEIDSRLNHFDADLKIVAGVAATAREAVKTLESSVTTLDTTITNDIKPVTDKLTKLGLKTVGFVTGGVLAANLIATPAWAAISGVLNELGKVFK